MNETRQQYREGLIGLLAIFLLFAGCTNLREAFPSLSPEADPLVVRAEQVAKSSADTVDAFLSYERKNHLALANNTALTNAAHFLRKHFKPAWQDFRTLTKLYKANRTPHNRGLLSASLESMRSHASTAETYIHNGGPLYPAQPSFMLRAGEPLPEQFIPPPPMALIAPPPSHDIGEIKTSLGQLTSALPGISEQLAFTRAENSRMASNAIVLRHEILRLRAMLKANGLTNDPGPFAPPLPPVP